MLRDFNGIRVIGDVHGNYEPFRELVDEAIVDKYFVISLGDIIDYGPNVLSCMELVCEFIAQGTGTLLKSNHDDRLYRHLEGNKVKLPLNFQETLRQLGHSVTQYDFAAKYSKAKWWLRFRNYFFAHASFLPTMLEVDSVEHPFVSKKFGSVLRKAALFGETDGTTDPATGFPNRTYNWIKDIPQNLTVVVGHSIRDYEKPFFQGDAIFLDTGSGKGGKLSCMDINFSRPAYPKFKTL